MDHLREGSSNAIFLHEPRRAVRHFGLAQALVSEVLFPVDPFIVLWKHRCKRFVDKLIDTAVPIGRFFEVYHKAPSLHQRFPDRVRRWGISHVNDISFEIQLTKPFERLPCRGVIRPVILTGLPCLKNPEGIGDVPFAKRLFVELVVVDERIHVITFFVKLFSCQFREILFQIQIVKIVTVLVDGQSQLFQCDPRVVGVALTQPFEIVVTVEELGNEILILGETAGEHEELLTFFLAGYQQLVTGKLAYLVMIRVTKEIQPGKRKLRYPVGEH